MYAMYVYLLLSTVASTKIHSSATWVAIENRLYGSKYSLTRRGLDIPRVRSVCAYAHKSLAADAGNTRLIEWKNAAAFKIRGI